MADPAVPHACQPPLPAAAPAPERMPLPPFVRLVVWPLIALDLYGLCSATVGDITHVGWCGTTRATFVTAVATTGSLVSLGCFCVLIALRGARGLGVSATRCLALLHVAVWATCWWLPDALRRLIERLA